MTSLIQQRFALDRRRVFAVWTVSSAAILSAFSVVVLAGEPTSVWRWIASAVWFSWLVVGIVRLRSSRAALRAFESEHGPGAGCQPDTTPAPGASGVEESARKRV
jgi:hypothetical protein